MLSSVEEDLSVHLEHHITPSPQEISHLNISKELSLANALLTKESEISALKETITRWKNKALEAEAESSYYYKQLEVMHSDYEGEITVMESEYTHQLNEKDKIIADIQQDLNHFLDQIYFDPWDHFFSECDGSSTAESVYERGRNLLEYSKKKILRQKRSRKSGVFGIQNLGTLEEKYGFINRHTYSGSTVCEESSRPYEKLKKKNFYQLFKSFPKILRRHHMPEKNKIHLLGREPSQKTLVYSFN